MITKDELQRYLTDYRAERDSINEMQAAAASKKWRKKDGSGYEERERNED